MVDFYYNDQGYLIFEKITKRYNPFITVIIGGRGIGKTYSVLKYLIDNNKKFIFVRRTSSEREFLRNIEYNPLKPFVDNLVIQNGKYSDKYFNDKKLICHCVNLSTVSKIRGLKGDEIEYIYYDEFIPDTFEKKLFNEYEALLQLYETINRNREIDGKEPLKIVLTANSNNIFNDIIDGFNLTDYIFSLRDKKQEYKYIKKKKIFIGDIKKSPISEKKKDTYIYKLTKGSNFYNMSINNSFYNDYSNNIGLPYQLKEYKPFADIGDIHVLIHSNKPVLYVTGKNRGVAKKQYYKLTDFFRMHNIYLTGFFIRKSIFFENSFYASLFQEYMI